MSDVLAAVVGTIGLITILVIAVYACFSDTETFKAIDEMIAERIKSNANQHAQSVGNVENVGQTEREDE